LGRVLLDNLFNKPVLVNSQQAFNNVLLLDGCTTQKKEHHLFGVPFKFILSKTNF